MVVFNHSAGICGQHLQIWQSAPIATHRIQIKVLITVYGRQVPRTVFAELTVLKAGAPDAVMTFNYSRQL
jgi:hypothetical protein